MLMHNFILFNTYSKAFNEYNLHLPLFRLNVSKIYMLNP